VREVREKFPKKIIIAGNVITGEMTEQLCIAGADIVKCGIGPGSVCTTRIMTGVGMPQLSGIMECADAAHGLGGHIIADGGCTEPGDVAKAFGAGADFVMLGGMLAGHNESELAEVAGQYEFYGMSSNRAMQEHGTRKDGYRSSEGRHIRLDARGPVEHTVTEILGGVRSACTYIGARRIKDIPKSATFVLVNATYNTVYLQNTVGD
jgi:GMP reductase